MQSRHVLRTANAVPNLKERALADGGTSVDVLFELRKSVHETAGDLICSVKFGKHSRLSTFIKSEEQFVG